MGPHSSGTTIAAIATAAGGAVGIVRISGPAVTDIGRSLCVPWPATPQSHRLYLGKVVDGRGEIVDQVLFCLMRGPRSYTGEDVLEIHCHGGRENLSRVLKLVLESGACPAAAGEFTRRAFLAGRMDLTQAEAVAASVNAQSERALLQAQRQLEGQVGTLVRDIRRRVTVLLAAVEGGLDFPDLDEDQTPGPGISGEMDSLISEITQLVEGFEQGGRALCQGAEIALVGRANAGKSSLFNALCERERALVDAEPGTTRDIVEARVHWSGVSITLIDTAGSRPGGTLLDQRAWRVASQHLRRADLLLFVVDGATGLTDEDQDLLVRLRATGPVLGIWNKIDLARCLEAPDGRDVEWVPCSAICGWGLEVLRKQVLLRIAPRLDTEEGVLITSARQAAALEAAAAALRQGRQILDARGGWDLVAADLRDCAVRLGTVTGEDAQPDVLDAIFARFCVGK